MTQPTVQPTPAPDAEAASPATQKVEDRGAVMPTDLDEAKLRQQALGARLRQMYDDVMNEPIPDEFLDVLRGADAKGGQGS